LIAEGDDEWNSTEAADEWMDGPAGSIPLDDRHSSPEIKHAPYVAICTRHVGSWPASDARGTGGVVMGHGSNALFTILFDF
jgi:hypothetical protein